jgi:DMSO reductase family type II enzyme heme b subunit
MGDKSGPVWIYYWNASRGAEELTAAGRATPQPSGKAVPHAATHADKRWQLVLALPDRPDGSPLAFAVWDGHAGDRDGAKWFSIWYVLCPAAKP